MGSSSLPYPGLTGLPGTGVTDRRPWLLGAVVGEYWSQGPDDLCPGNGPRPAPTPRHFPFSKHRLRSDTPLSISVCPSRTGAGRCHCPCFSEEDRGLRVLGPPAMASPVAERGTCGHTASLWGACPQGLCSWVREATGPTAPQDLVHTPGPWRARGPLGSHWTEQPERRTRPQPLTQTLRAL